MDPVTGGAIAGGVSAGARILGALIGRAIAQGDYDTAEQLQRQALEQYGTMDPDALLKIDVSAQDTEFGNVTEDASLRDAQLRALSQLGDMATGQSPEDAAAYAQAQQESGAFERGLREAAARRLSERGISGNSGLAVASQMGAAQQATQQKANADLQTAADARRRALAALGQYGNMAGNIRGMDYQRAADRAAAQDSINRFNAGQRFNQAQGTFNNRMDVAGAKAGQYGTLAGMYQHRGDTTAAMWAGIGDATGDAVDAFGNPLKKKGGA